MTISILPEVPVPDNLCKSCMSGCGVLINSQYLQSFLDAWSTDGPLPECLFYKEVSYHGLDGVRP
jgi:hypothetical protein